MCFDNTMEPPTANQLLSLVGIPVCLHPKFLPTKTLRWEDASTCPCQWPWQELCNRFVDLRLHLGERAGQHSPCECEKVSTQCRRWQGSPTTFPSTWCATKNPSFAPCKNEGVLLLGTWCPSPQIANDELKQTSSVLMEFKPHKLKRKANHV